MDVTLKLPDDLVREARHHAIEEDKSLSAWMADLVRCELTPSDSKTKPAQSWIDAFSGDSDDDFLNREFPLEDRNAIPDREFSFDPDEA